MCVSVCARTQGEGGRERERARQTDRQTEKKKNRDDGGKQRQIVTAHHPVSESPSHTSSVHPSGPEKAVVARKGHDPSVLVVAKADPLVPDYSPPPAPLHPHLCVSFSTFLISVPVSLSLSASAAPGCLPPSHLHHRHCLLMSQHMPKKRDDLH